jgi:hypothetical protein
VCICGRKGHIKYVSKRRKGDRNRKKLSKENMLNECSSLLRISGRFSETEKVWKPKSIPVNVAMELQNCSRSSLPNTSFPFHRADSGKMSR